MVMAGFKQDTAASIAASKILTDHIDNMAKEMERERNNAAFMMKMRALQDQVKKYADAYIAQVEYTDALEEENKILRDSFANSEQNIVLINDQKAINEGLKAVARALLNELREKDPNNTYLDKKVRDRLFNAFHNNEVRKINEERGKMGLPPYREV